MTKNIAVLDENGNKTGETYPKRAKGLVKSGRAEYVDEAAIRLVAPSSVKNERTGIKMNNTDNINANDIVRKLENLLAELDRQTAAAYSTLEKAENDVKTAMVGNIAQAYAEDVGKAIDFYKALLIGKVDGAADAPPVAAPDFAEKE